MNDTQDNVSRAHTTNIDEACTPWERRDFWQRFKWHMQASSGVRCARVTTDGWMWHDTDLTAGNLLSLIRVRLGDIGVKYTLNDANAETIASYLCAHRAAIDSHFDQPVEWRAVGDGSHVIEVRRPVESFERSMWEDHFTWLQRQLETFDLALAPFIGRMPPKGDVTRWDEQSFLRELTTWNPGSVEIAKALLDWTVRNGAFVSWGRGRRCGSFSVSVSQNGVAYQPVSVRTDGTMSLLFAQLKKTTLFEDEQRRMEFLERLNEVHHISLPESVIASRPTLPLGLLGDAAAFDKFVSVMGWFKASVRSRRP